MTGGQNEPYPDIPMEEQRRRNIHNVNIPVTKTGHDVPDADIILYQEKYPTTMACTNIELSKW